MAAWYEPWFDSAYYHKLYFQRKDEEIKSFIDCLLRHLQPTASSRMLDAACGRGRHSKLLAAAGYDVTAIDGTPESIAYAKQAESDTLHFYRHDIRLPFWMAYFDYAFNLATAFGYFATQREHDNAVRTISQSLKPGGLLVFDYLNVHFAEAYLQHNETAIIEETHYEIHRWHDRDHFYKRISISDKALEQPLEVTEKIAKFSLGDFTDMLSYQNMQVTEVFGDYQLHPYHVRKTPRMIILAKKKAHK